MVENLSVIFQVSLVALGLVIALYAIIIQSLSEIAEKRLKEFKKAKTKTDAHFEKLSQDKDNQTLIAEYNELVRQKKMLSNPPYHYDWGYVVSGILFSISLVTTYVAHFWGVDSLGNFDFFVINAPFILLCGILNFIYVWIRTMIDLRNLTFVKFDCIEEKDKTKKI